MVKQKILVLGNIGFDFVSRVSLLPIPGGVARIEGVERYFGGRAANIAVALGNLGMPIALGAVVGGDFETGGYLRYLLSKNIDLTQVTVAKGERTATFRYYHDGSGKGYGFYDPNVEKDRFKSTLRSLIIDESIDIVILARSIDSKAVTELTQKISPTTSFVLALGPDVFRFSHKALISLLGRAKYVFANQAEMQIVKNILGLKKTTNLFERVGRPLEVLVVTRGAAGSSIFIRGKRVIRLNALRINRISSPLGAGDNYLAAFLFATVMNYSAITAGKAATNAAALSLAIEGPQLERKDLEKIFTNLAK